MSQSNNRGAPNAGLGWADVEACTLPTAARPLRVAEFDDLFATTLQAVDHDSDTHARLTLSGDPSLASRTRRLAAAETACCSFFAFDITEAQPGQVTLDIEVPPDYADVLAGLLDRANASLGGAL